MTRAPSNFRRAQGNVSIDSTMRDSLAILSEAEGMAQTDLIRDGLMPRLRKHKHLLPLSFTVLRLEDGKWRPPSTGGSWTDPAGAILFFRGDCLAILRGTVYPNEEMFLEKRPGKRKVWVWWRECLQTIMATLEPLYPQYEIVFRRIALEMLERKMIHGWANGGFLARLLAKPETNAAAMDARLVAFLNSAMLWFQSSSSDPTFWTEMREGVRFLAAADETLHSWCADAMLRIVGITARPAT